MNNGHESNLEERMQRAERIIAALAGIQDETQAELRTLAKSQVLMTETMDKLGQGLNELRQRVNELTQSQQAGDERLNALIDYFRRHLEEHGQQ